MPLDDRYEDRTVRIDPSSVTIARYYFPWGGSKTIARSDIVAVAVRPASRWSRWRLWGSSNLRNWFPLDTERRDKTHVVEIDIGKRIVPTITPTEPERVADLIRP